MRKEKMANGPSDDLVFEESSVLLLNLRPVNDESSDL
jgi:hypothetical protein